MGYKCIYSNVLRFSFPPKKAIGHLNLELCLEVRSLKYLLKWDVEKGVGFVQGLVNIRELTPDHLLCLLGKEDDSFGVFFS